MPTMIPLRNRIGMALCIAASLGLLATISRARAQTSSHGTVSITVETFVDRDAKVTGGGCYSTPNGSVANQPSLSGSTFINLNAKYVPHQTTPLGFVRITLSSFKFVTTGLEWLAANSSGYGFIKGVGTVNQSPGYRCFVTVKDGGTPSSVPDAVRVRIVRISDDSLVYDNMWDEPASALPTTPVTTGNLFVHQ